MQNNSYRQAVWTWFRRSATFIGIAMLIYNGLVGIFGSSESATVHAQTDMYLSRRVDMIEQRIYSIESRLNQVSTQSRPPIIATLPSTTQNDIDLLRTSVEGMRLRLGEVECGLLKLDERTLPAAQRRSTRTGAASDRCRENYGAPITLSARPGN